MDSNTVIFDECKSFRNHDSTYGFISSVSFFDVMSIINGILESSISFVILPSIVIP